MSYTIFTREDGTTFEWKDCEISGCPNQICLSKGETRFCWPHSKGDQTVGQMIKSMNGLKEHLNEPD